jgi:hypothetical protein
MLWTPTLRLGVTGLSRSGKTVFITTLVRALMGGARLPFFPAYAEGRLIGAHLEPQPDDEVPRFDYEAHLARLGETPPEWPHSTRQISELRVVLTYAPINRMKRAFGQRTLNIDIVDYPGEWLLDMALLRESYTQWSTRALAAVRSRPSLPATEAFNAFLNQRPLLGEPIEKIAIEGAALFTKHLLAVRETEAGIATLGPGRFLLPGDLEGSPLLTFFPLAAGSEGDQDAKLRAMLERRYESYRTHVVKPFFQKHFSRLDRQIVLVDVLSALNSGPSAVHDLEDALYLALKAFRPGVNSWVAKLFRPRIDRVLFAATKADHLHHFNHDRLEAILKLLTDRASLRAVSAGAEIRTLAMAALRATREGEVRDGRDVLHCISGVPLPGETIAGDIFDGAREAIVFPGDLPADPQRVLESGGTWMRSGAATFVRFRPPRVRSTPSLGDVPQVPHIRLDRALDFLIGDWLA